MTGKTAEDIREELRNSHFITAPLGHPFSQRELEIKCKGVYGGVAFPGKNPGFAVVIAMDKEKRGDNYGIYLLDETECFDIRELIRLCDVLDQKYEPKLWIGDRSNDAGYHFIRELNAERQKSEKQARRFNLYQTPILHMENLYPYILGHIRSLLDPDNRQLFLKDSKIVNYLSAIETGKVVELQLGEYPAIEAIAITVLEMRNRERDYPEYDERANMAMAESYGMPTTAGM
jgi:hypothetical protein